MLVTPDTDFSNISWNWLCYQRAFSAIYPNYFWKFTLFADVTDIIVYTYAEFGMTYLKKQMKVYTLFRVLRWEFASV